MRRVYKLLALSFVLFIPASAYVGPSSQNAPVEIEGWDVSVLDTRIARLAAKANAAGASSQDKIAAANAYLQRANVFRDAGRPTLYKLAVGDFRRVLRLQPQNREAREKLEEIVSIYESLRRTAPENGNEGDVYNDPSVRYRLKPQPIKFPPGEKTLTLSENLPPDTAYVYEFDGSAGQRMFIKMNADGAPASFGVYKGRLDHASQLISGVKEWRGAITGDGKYLIKVGPKEKAASYKLVVTAG